MTRKRFIKLLRAVYTFPTREKYIQMCISFAHQRHTPYWEMLVPELLRDVYIGSGVPLPREIRFSRDLHRWQDEIRRWNETQACWQEAQT